MQVLQNPKIFVHLENFTLNLYGKANNRITKNFEKEGSRRTNSTDDLLYSGIKNPKIDAHQRAQLNLDVSARKVSRGSIHFSVNGC